MPFSNSYAPGKKPFDFYLAQVSYTAERAQSVDLSDGYYFVAQSVVALTGNPLAKVTTVSGLKGYKFGAQVGTTAYDTIKNVIQPTATISVYNDNDAAVKALQAKQIDGLVVDLPTAFYVTAAQIVDAKGNPLASIVGQFPVAAGPNAEHFSLVLSKGSALTSCVNQALGALKSDGTLDQITKTWLSDKANAPVFQPWISLAARRRCQPSAAGHSTRESCIALPGRRRGAGRAGLQRRPVDRDRVRKHDRLLRPARVGRRQLAGLAAGPALVLQWRAVHGRAARTSPPRSG